MNKQSQKKIVQINHALSGVMGQDLKLAAFKLNDNRKQILKKLQRKKKLSTILFDQLHYYLEKFPQQRLGLHQQSFKKKKAKGFQSQDKNVYKCGVLHEPNLRKLTKNDPFTSLKKVQHFFQYKIDVDELQQQFRQILQQ